MEHVRSAHRTLYLLILERERNINLLFHSFMHFTGCFSYVPGLGVEHAVSVCRNCAVNN